jgi:hypothetical protein
LTVGLAKPDPHSDAKTWRSFRLPWRETITLLSLILCVLTALHFRFRAPQLGEHIRWVMPEAYIHRPYVAEDDRRSSESIEWMTIETPILVRARVIEGQSDDDVTFYKVRVEERLKGNSPDEFRCLAVHRENKVPTYVKPGRLLLLFLRPDEPDRPDLLYPPIDLEVPLTTPFLTLRNEPIHSPDKLVERLRRALRETPQPAPSEASSWGLKVPRDARLEAYVFELLASTEPDDQRRAISMIAYFPSSRAIASLQPFLTNGLLVRASPDFQILSPWTTHHYDLREAAVDALTAMGAPPVPAIKLTEPAEFYRPVPVKLLLIPLEGVMHIPRYNGG